MQFPRLHATVPKQLQTRRILLCLDVKRGLSCQGENAEDNEDVRLVK